MQPRPIKPVAREKTQLAGDLERLSSSPGYLHMREVWLREYERLNRDWRTTGPAEIAHLQARSLAYQEILNSLNQQYAMAGGQDKLTEPVL